MATSDFDVELFERRLHTLKDSQESIQGLSAWCLERRQHHKKIVATWLQVLKKVKVEHRLTLFYLANDVIQYSKRKNFEFVESWGTTLQRATTMVRDEKVKHRILRIFKIWDQRQVYDEEFLADLSGLISAAPKKKPDPQPVSLSDEFQAALLISTMRSCATLEQATDARLRDLRESNIDIENAEELCASLKDRRRVEDAEKEVDMAVRNVENYVRALEAEIRERTQVLELLEQADQFYETQRGEVKIVTNAYRNFGSRVKNLKKKLDELLPTLVSPLPSPDINAPSPSPDSDIELPGDENQTTNQSTIIDVAPPSLYGSYSHEYDPAPVPAPDMVQVNETGDFTNNFSSFMGGNMDFGNMRNLFNERSTTPTGMAQQYNESLEAKPIEVINMRPPKNESSTDDFNISSFLKTVLPSSDVTPDPGGIPGLGLDASDSQVGSPQRPNYRHSPVLGQLPVTPVSRMIGNQGAVGLNNCQMSHSTPLSVRNLSGESHTPSPYSSQNSQSNITGPFDTPSNAAAVNPLPPPPLPPPIFLDDENCYNKLPPKFPTWTPANEAIKEPSSKWEEKGNSAMPIGKNSMNPSWPGENDDNRWESSESVWPNAIRGKSDILSETPESPPMYEKSGFTDPVEYDDSQQQEPILSSAADVDHRVISIPLTAENQLPYRLMKAADVDHRNLISLTGSPANHNNSTEPSLNLLSNNNNLWPAGDQDYRFLQSRQHMQPGDIVESVDMEMSDDETDSKPKGRVLVDVRSQDRDIRVGVSQQAAAPQSLDMDMRMIPLPTGQMPVARGQMMQDVHVMHAGPPPPPPPPQFHQGQPNFHPGQPDFHHNLPVEFHQNQSNFHQNRGPPNFLQNQQQEFHPPGQDFHPMHQSQQDFHQSQQDFDYHENQHNLRPGQEFHGNRYNQLSGEHPHRDTNFHRNDIRGRGGRGFPRNRRDRYSEDHGLKQRNVINNRKARTPTAMGTSDQQHHGSSPEDMPNSRPLLLQPPDTVVILDDEGMPIGMPDNEQIEDVIQDRTRQITPDRRLQQQDGLPCRDLENTQVQRDSFADCDSPANQEPSGAATRSQESPDQRASQGNDQADKGENPQYGSGLEYDEHLESDSGRSESCLDTIEAANQTQDQGEAHNQDEPVQLSEQLEALMNSSNHDLKRPAANGSFDEQESEDLPCGKKRLIVPNGPQTPVAPESAPNGPQMILETHPVPLFEHEGPSATCPIFRPRLAGPTPFPPWRGGPPRGRAFRGGPRAPWIDRGPRGPPGGNFMPRGLKRGGQFRGGGFRGRGRGNNW